MRNESTYYFTGSYPPLQKGLHLKILLMAINKPFSAPYFSMACIAYSEHVGVNLQLSPRYGDMAAL